MWKFPHPCHFYLLFNSELSAVVLFSSLSNFDFGPGFPSLLRETTTKPKNPEVVFFLLSLSLLYHVYLFGAVFMNSILNVE